MNVGERLAEILVAGGAKALFGVPGGQTLPLYGAAPAAGLNHVLMRDERSAACAADAYARLSGQVGFCDATVGPGTTNLVSGIAEAHASSIPIVAIIADVHSSQAHLRRRANASQALEQAALLQPITKWFARVEHPDYLETVLDQAIRVAVTGRPGPVAVEIPEDVFAGTISPDAPRRDFGAATFAYPRFRPAPSATDVAAAVDLITGARRPLIVAGGGVTFGGGSAAVSDLAATHSLPIVTTVSGKGAIAESNRLAGGVIGVFGTVLGNTVLLESDLLIVMGSKLGKWATHDWRVPLVRQRVIHIDIDGEEIGRTGPVTLGIVADAHAAAEALRAELSKREYEGRNWLAEVQVDGPGGRMAQAGIDPRQVADALASVLRPDDVIVCDASLASRWGAAYLPVERSRRFVAPRGLAGIGWGGGGAIGARFAVDAEQRVVLLAGDGGWGYSLGELETAVRNGLDITYVILNNAGLGWITHGEEKRGYPGRSVFGDVDFAATARAMGSAGARVTNVEDLEGVLHTAMADPNPHLVDVVTAIDASPVLAFDSVRGAKPHAAQPYS